jgi:hypothetical protein
MARNCCLFRIRFVADSFRDQHGGSKSHKNGILEEFGATNGGSEFVASGPYDIHGHRIRTSFVVSRRRDGPGDPV